MKVGYRLSSLNCRRANALTPPRHSVAGVRRDSSQVRQLEPFVAVKCADRRLQNASAMQLRPSLTVVGICALVVPLRAHAGALVIPPLEADVGETVPIGNTVTGVATDVLVGVHWGSLAWKRTGFELGIGFIRSRRDLLEPIVLGRSTMSMSSPQTSLDLDGGYVTLGHTIFDRHHLRTWVTARGELLHGEFEGRAFMATGVAARIASELYAPVRVSGSGVMVGTFAIGVYVEASHRDIESELGPDGVTSGISIRLPFTIIGT